MKIAIIDYGSGNLRSAAKAVERMAGEAGRPATVETTADPAVVAAADRVILPGVGAFGDCRAGLDAIDGMIEAMDYVGRDRARPFLGICVGMQLLADVGREYGDHPGLGWISGAVTVLPPGMTDSEGRKLKIPHMGWNQLTFRTETHPIVRGLSSGAYAYFVHSYRFEPTAAADVLAETHHGVPIAAIVANGTVVGTQFHPEKSQETGLTILKNFIEWSP
ncbi:imidazole glycerol phosphate synthase subunit HisH [Fodinicurvata sp. EGI_FJ10296]|jgi:glutamine amidotransferase|uniref:imidazole glycerol phosphate synthase subunit HisH n=1 Tax=Fodinicurvata sp. EGI_FJ10296 TaxID=3231908 RepID=UPI003453CA81